jgi:GTPase
VSNVTGENLDYLKMFLNLLTSRSPKTDDDPAEFQIDDTYSVPGVGTVVSGTNLKGTIRCQCYKTFSFVTDDKAQ